MFNKSKKIKMFKKFPKLLKIVTIVITIFSMVFLLVFKTPLFLSDIRPAQLKGNPILKNDGLAFLKKSQQAHNIALWKKSNSIKFEITHKFSNKRARFLINPSKQNPIKYDYVSIPQRENSSYFKSRMPRSKFFLAMDNKGIFKDDGKHRKYNRFSTRFFYKGISHLIEFPFKMSSADVLEYLGKKEWNGNTYDLVFATWNSLDPSLHINQYIMWINQQTGLIDRFDTTGRDISPFDKAQVIFKYANYGKAIFPTTIKVQSVTFGKSPIMDLKVSKVIFEGSK